MDFVRDYMRALLAKEIDAAAELQEQKSRVVSQKYCTGSTLPRGCYCPSPTYDLWCGSTKRGAFVRSNHREKSFLTYTVLMRQIA